MFAQVPLAAPPSTTPYYHNKYENLDCEAVDNQLVASEGIYKATEEISLAYPAAPASEPPPNPNPLTPYASPLTSGMHLSVVYIDGSVLPSAVRTPSHPDAFAQNGHNENNDTEHDDASTEADQDFVGSQPATPGLLPEHRGSNGSTGLELMSSLTSTSVFDSVYDPNSKRKKRLGTSANGTTSTFVSRAITDQNIGARLYEHKPEDLFVFANVARYLSWLDLGSTPLAKHEPLTKLMLSLASVVCHDVNQVTKSNKGLDVIMGTTTGDIIWYDPMTTRYLRYNKQRCINPSSVTYIQWLPGSESLFMAAHADGSLLIYDKERDDTDFQAQLREPQATEGEYFPPPTIESAAPMSVLRSAHDQRSKSNPVSYLALSRQTINAFAISPDQTHVAVACDDGCLKIVDYRQERLLDVYSSYYGGLTCVSWSPDGHYILTGGKDDIITIWSFVERRIIARCYGHSSFITCVRFDPWRCDSFNYRFGSVAEDGRLCLWDFALASLHKPSTKIAKHGALEMPESAHRPHISGLHDHQPSSSVIDGVAYHQVESRLSTAILSPITVKEFDTQPPSDLVFLKDSIMTATMGRRCGRIRVWRRPAVDFTPAV